MTTQYGPSQLEAMAWTIEQTGIGAIPVTVLRQLGREANRFGVPSGVINILVDSSAPRVARDRAFGFVAVALANRQTAPLTSVPRAA